MVYLRAIWAFLWNLPELYKILREILSFLSRFIDAYDRNVKAKELKDAIKESSETKNTQKLEKLFGG